MEKSHWRLQPLNWPNHPPGKTWANHHIQVANRTLWPDNPSTGLINCLARHEQTTIFRLRTGHCGLRAHLKQIGSMDSALCDCKEAENRRSATSSRTFPSGRNRDTSCGRRMSQPPTSCGERWKTCATPHSSWQHVDWGSKHGWSTTEEEEEGTPMVTWCSGVNTGTGWPSVSILWLGDIGGLICNFYLSVAARTFFWSDLSLRYTSMSLGIKQPTDNNSISEGLLFTT